MGVLMLALLTSTPIVPLGSSLSHRDTGRTTALPDAVPRSLPEACSPRGSCPSQSRAPSFAAGVDPIGYQLNHTLAWSRVASPPPGFGDGGGMIANSSSGLAVAFGGVSSGALVNSTFAYTEAANTWSAVSSPVAPSPRSDFAFAFDPTTGTAVLFGGLTNLTTLGVSNETWTYSVGSAHWSPVTGGPAPSAREAAAFAIVPSLGVAFLYGGWNRNYSTSGSLTYSDLWEYNLSTGAWSRVSVSGPRPPPLEGAAMAWDPGTARLELFGGCYPCSSAVWQFNPETLAWTAPTTPPAGPAPRAAASWGYDPALSADLLFGGTNGNSTFNDTYVFYPTNDTWLAETLPPAPEDQSGAASAFLSVPNNETWLLAGGQSGVASYSDLWRLSATANLSLRALNASSLAPLTGAGVNLSGRRAGLTDSAGYLNLTQINVVGPALNVTDVPWFFPDNQTLWLPPGQPATETVDLTPEPLGTVSAHAVSALGPPVPGAFVNLSVDAVRINAVPEVTNASGNASFHGVPPGAVNVTLRDLDWRPAFVRGALAPGGTLNATVVVFPDPVITVTALGRLPGDVLAPLTSVQVVLNGTPLGVTGLEGTLTNFTTAFGLVTIAGEVTGFFPTVAYVSVPFTGPANATLVLSSRPYGLLAVTVLRSNDSYPLSGASVSASTTFPIAFGSYEETNLTDAKGVTSLSLPEGTYALAASAPGYLASSVRVVNVTPGSNLPRTIYLDPIPPGRIDFIVRAQSTGQGVGAANITDPGVLSVRANAWGYFNATNLAPGNYYFEVSAPGFLANDTPVILLSNENLTLLVNLTRLPFVPGGPTWPFNLFPGGLDQLWPFLLVPLLLVVGALVFASVLRGEREEETIARTGSVDSPSKETAIRVDRTAESSSGPPS